MKWYVYNIAVLAPDEDLKQMQIKDAQIKSERKLTQEDIDAFSETKKGNVLAFYLGIFNERLEKNQEVLASNYYEVEEIQELKKKWSDTQNG